MLIVATVAMGVTLGIAAETAAFDASDVRLWLPDLIVGWTLVGCGLVAAVRRPGNRCGVLLAAAGLAWFLGNFSDQLVYLHRGVLVHVIVTFPDGRAVSRGQRVAVAAGYVASLLPALWESASATVGLSTALVAYCALDYRRAVGVRRRARRQALAAATGFAIVVAASAVARATFPIDIVGRPTLLAYQIVVCGTGVGLLVALLGSDSERVDVTDLVVELGTARTRTLQASLAEALGDPSLVVGYRDTRTGTYADAEGRPLRLPDDPDRARTYVDRDGEPVAVLVHDPTVLADPLVQEAVASAMALSAANTRLLEEVSARVAEVDASRRRLLQTRDDERARLERRLRDGAERRLTEVAANLSRDPHLAQAQVQVEQALDELRRLARGIHPRLLAEKGLESALWSLVKGLPLQVELEMGVREVPEEVAAAAYFVCAEGLANVVKHSAATYVLVSVVTNGNQLSVVVEDDGVGGADPTRGSGLRGLADRVATLGGTIRMSPAGSGGTHLAAEIPLGGEDS